MLKLPPDAFPDGFGADHRALFQRALDLIAPRARAWGIGSQFHQSWMSGILFDSAIRAYSFDAEGLEMKGRCPFCGAGKLRAWLVTDRWRCFACSQGGDSMKLWRQGHNLPEQLADDLLITVTRQTRDLLPLLRRT